MCLIPSIFVYSTKFNFKLFTLLFTTKLNITGFTFKEHCDFGYNASDCNVCDNTGVWRGDLYASGTFQNEIVFTLTFSGPDCSTILSGNDNAQFLGVCCHKDKNQ